MNKYKKEIIEYNLGKVTIQRINPEQRMNKEIRLKRWRYLRTVRENEGGA